MELMTEDDNPYRPKILKRPDPLHDLQLMRDLEIVNARTMSELGPPSLAGLSSLSVRNDSKTTASVFLHKFDKEADDMDISHAFKTAALVGALTACGTQSNADEIQQLPAPVSSDVESSPSGSERRLEAETVLAGDLTPSERAQPKFRNSYNSCAEISSGSTWQIIDCISEEFYFQGNRLNEAYHHLLSILSDQQRSELVKQQIRWIANRDLECKLDPETEDQGQLIDARSCALNRTTIRANELEERISAETAHGLSAITPELQTVREAAAVPESKDASNNVTVAVPDEILAFVPPKSRLLAYKRFDLTGDGNEDAVLIVRHPVIDDSRLNFSKNPCDLIILHRDGIDYKLAGKSSKVIDCTYKIFARESADSPDDLNGRIELKPQEIICNEEKDKPTGISTVYSFKYSEKNDAWYLNKAEATYISYDAVGGTGRGYFANEKVEYPDDISFIEIDSFDPKDLKEAYEKNRKIEFFEDESKEIGEQRNA